MKNVAISGCVSYDKIGNVFSLGGITYNVLSLSLDKEIEVFPITYIGKDLKEEFLSLLSSNVDLKYVIEIENTNRNILHIYNNERYEFITTFSPEININMLTKIEEEIEFILINPVMGWEFSFETLKEIKKIPIPSKMIDIHSLALGIKGNGERYQKVLRPDESEILIDSFDIIQMNMREYYAMVQKKFPVGIEYFGPEKIIIVSDAEKGAYIYNNKKLKHFSSSNPSKKHIVGAGDIFSGIFISFFLKMKDPFDSVKNTVDVMERINGDTIIEKIDSIKEKYFKIIGL